MDIFYGVKEDIKIRRSSIFVSEQYYIGTVRGNRM